MVYEIADWRHHLFRDEWDEIDPQSLINQFYRASELGMTNDVLALRAELEVLQDKLQKAVPATDRVDGIESTPDHLSVQEISNSDPQTQHRTKWAAHWLSRVKDMLAMDFSNPSPHVPSRIAEIERFTRNWFDEQKIPPVENPETLDAKWTNTAKWHAAHILKLSSELEFAFNLVGQPGKYRVGKKQVLEHMNEVTALGISIGQHYEVLRSKWSEPLVVSEQKARRGRAAGSVTNRKKNDEQMEDIVRRFKKLLQNDVPQAQAVSQIAKENCAENKEKKIGNEKNRIRNNIARRAPHLWQGRK